MDDLELVLKTAFLQEEANQLISEAEHFFLSLEMHPDDTSIIEQLFRIAHNIKGSSKAAGFTGLSEFTHQLESLLSKLKKHEIPVETGIVNLMLRCNDHLQLMVESLKTNMDAQTDSSQILYEIGRFMSGEAQAQITTLTPALEALAELVPETPQAPENNEIQDTQESPETTLTHEVSTMTIPLTPEAPAQAPIQAQAQPVEVAKAIEKYLEFSLGSQSYAVPLEAVREVIALPEITSVPYTPSFFLGIMNLRGQVISVMDLRLKLNLKDAAKNSDETAVVICQLGTISMGVVVGAVTSVLALTPNDIQPRPSIESTVDLSYIKGVTRKEGRLVLLLDIASLLSLQSLSTTAARGTQAPQLRAA